MKFILKLMRFIGIVICFVYLALPNLAQADVIWEPLDDNFYDKHINECVYVGRYYSSNTLDGSITIYESPVSVKEVGTYIVTEGYFVQYIYEDKNGVAWGILWLDGKSGWTPMSKLTLIYDFQSFHEDYQHTFEKYSGVYDDELINPFLLWSFPGSGVIEAKYEEPKSIPDITGTYKDEEGRLWGRVDYYFALQGWICLDDPLNEDIPVFGKHTLIKTNPSDKTELDDYLNKEMNEEWIFPIVLVILLVTVTAIITKVLYKKGNSH